MYCEEANFSKLSSIELGKETSKRLEKEFLTEFYEKNWAQYPDSEFALCFLAEEYLRSKSYEKGVPVLEKLVNLEPEKPIHHYQLSCLYACLKNKEKAFEYLENAIELGFDDREQIEENEAFKSIREEPRFQELLQKLDDFDFDP